MAAQGQPLSSLPAGSAGTVTAVEVAPEHKGRLLEMGLLPGTRVEVVRRAPLGDPVELRIRQFHLSIRRSEAAYIHVAPH